MEQLTIYVENKVGSLSKLLGHIAESNINVRSVSTERANMSEIRLIVDDPKRAQDILEKEGITSHIVDIVVVELRDQPGELANIARLLDSHGINIDYAYGIDNGVASKGLFAIKTSIDAAELRKILTDFVLY